MKRIFILAATCLLLQCADAQVTHWAGKLSGTDVSEGHAIAVDAFNNVYTTGLFEGTVDFDPGPGVYNLTAGGAAEDVFICKLNSSGNLVWAKRIGKNNYDGGRAIGVDAVGNVYVTGYFTGNDVDFDPGTGTFNLSSVNANYRDGFVLKLDAAGNFIWATRLAELTVISPLAIYVYPTGAFLITGNYSSGADFDTGAGTFLMSPFGLSDGFLVKYDASGNFSWAKHLGGPDDDSANGVTADDAGNIYIIGNFRSVADLDPGVDTFQVTSAGEADIYICKLDDAGNFVFATSMEGNDADGGISIVVDANQNIFLAGEFRGSLDVDPGINTFSFQQSLASFADGFVCKLDAAGNFKWAWQSGSVEYGTIQITLDDSANVYTTGAFFGPTDFDPGVGVYNLASRGMDIFISKFDSSGGLGWASVIGNAWQDYGNSIAVDNAGEAYITGSFLRGPMDFDVGPGIINLYSFNESAFVLRVAERAPYVVQGNVFGDYNANCIPDTSDIERSQILIKAEPGPLYGLTDISGNYAIYIFDSGAYTITNVTQDTLWEPSCTTSYAVHLNTLTDTVTGIDFALHPAFYCQRLNVDIIASRFIKCGHPNFMITYANTGTIAAANSYIEVDFGNDLQPQSSTLPWSSVAGNVYTFPIGNIAINQSDTFRFTAYVNCSINAGATLCVTAHIYPDSLCVPPPAGWDKSQTKVTGACIQDSLVCFTIKNQSQAPSGNMNGPAQWRLYVNDTLITQGVYQLAGRDSVVKCYPANGKTFRLEADQHPPHPGNSHPQAIVESCGSPFTSGFVNTVPQDDEDLFTETFCGEVFAPHDPNDKQVAPTGITANHYITGDDELEYMIRFQNTGNDTAFKVIIKDAIDTDVLDIATLTSGASSHPYTFNIYGQGIAEWTFNNILLPDSNVNESESHGFVKFKIRQLPGNATGTHIENNAEIYFDFNEAVVTNVAWNVVNPMQPTSFLSASANSITDARCHGDSSGTGSVVATGGLPPYQYLWRNGETTQTATSLTAGNNAITITDGTGTVFTDSVTIQEPALLQTAITGTMNVLCFGDGTGKATASPAGGTPPYSYEWSDSEGGQTATVLHAGTHSVTVWDGNLCTTTASVTITEPAQLAASVSTQSSVLCFGGDDAAAKVNVTGGAPSYSAAWSNGQIDFTATNLSAGNYMVTVVDMNNCELVTSITIHEGFQVPTGYITGADSANINQAATYLVNSGLSYTWSITNGTILSGQGTNTVEVDWTTMGQGTLQVIATAQGCADTVSKIVTLVDPTGIEGMHNSFEIYPNPTTGNSIIKTQGPLQNSPNLLKLFDSIGKQVLEQTAEPAQLQQGIILNMKELHSGVYFLTIQTATGTNNVKVVKY